MLNRSVLLLVLVCLLGGYSVRGEGQTDKTPASVDSPVEAGDNVTLHYQQARENRSPSTVECVVVAVRGSFVKCQPAGDPDFRDARGERWRNLTFVTEIVKHSRK